MTVADTRYIFVLGAPNAEDGELSAISRSRVDTAEALYRSDSSARIVATGGYGAHFNRAPEPHRAYVERELRRRGVRVGAVPATLLKSANTVEDAIEIDAFVRAHALKTIDVVTSTFHVPRCRIVFGCVMPTASITFHGAPDPGDVDPLIIAHEWAACGQLAAQGGVMINGTLKAIPTSHQ